MPGGERNHLLQLQAERDRGAVGHQLGDGFAHGVELRYHSTFFSTVVCPEENATTTLTSAASPHNPAEMILTPRTASRGAATQIASTKPKVKFASTRAKKARSRRQRVSLISPAINSTHT